MVFDLQPKTEAGQRAVNLVINIRDQLNELALHNDNNSVFAYDSIDLMQRTGLLSICVPESMGGLGLSSLYDLCLVLKELGRVDGSVAIASSMHLAITAYHARILRTVKNDISINRKTKWLAEVGAHKMLISSAVAEIGKESWNIATTANKVSDGWLIEGQKVLVSMSPSATHFYTRVKVVSLDSPMMGTAMISAKANGVTVHEDWQGMGLRGSGSGRVIFDNVLVEEADFVIGGQWGVPDPVGFEGRAAASIPIVASYWGMAEAAKDIIFSEYEECHEKENERNRSVSVASQNMHAEVVMLIGEIRAVMHCALENTSSMFESTAPKQLDDKTGRVLLQECLIAGMLVERSAFKIIDIAMHILGGKSYMRNHELGRLYRDIKAASFMRPFSPPERYVEFLTGKI